MRRLRYGKSVQAVYDGKVFHQIVVSQSPSRTAEHEDRDFLIVLCNPGVQRWDVRLGVRSPRSEKRRESGMMGERAVAGAGAAASP